MAGGAGQHLFFAIAALIQFLIVIYATDVLHIADPARSSYLQAATAIGIGLGSFAAGYLSGGKIEYGLIPLGSIGRTICGALLGRPGLSFNTVALDEDGFLQITDRLSRFSKIGGEMVPHIKVEEKLHELAEVTEQTFVVAGVPDEKKGERLVVLHRLREAELPGVLEKLSQSDLPNLWKPCPDQFFRVEAFPLLGSGKLDLRRLRELAMATRA
jgi:hypothetical protein